VLIVIGLLAVTAAAVAYVDVPGTTTPTSDEPRCDLRSTIAVKDTTFTTKLVDSSYSQSVTRSGLLSRPTTASLNPLSFFGAENVEVRATLSGDALDRTLSARHVVGRLGEGASKTVVFKATRLPFGTYTLQYEMTYGGGSDSFQRRIEVNC
jgi:hypothetical protein